MGVGFGQGIGRYQRSIDLLGHETVGFIEGAGAKAATFRGLFWRQAYRSSDTIVACFRRTVGHDFLSRVPSSGYCRL